MPVKKTMVEESEKNAREQLEFYGFWLWTYQHALLPEEDGLDFSSLPYNLNERLYCDGCISQSYKDCTQCGKKVEHDKHLILQKIYTPWISTQCVTNSLVLRFSSSEILMDAYHNSGGIKKYNYSKGYIISQRGLFSRVIDAKFLQLSEDNYAKSLNVTMEIDFSMPSSLIVEDIMRIKNMIEWGNVITDKIILDAEKSNSTNSVSYVRILSAIKKHIKAAFISDFSSRALGFWLWDNISHNKKFRSVPKAIEHLKFSGEYPLDFLEKTHLSGQANSLDQEEAMRKYRRYHQQTAKCIKQREVLSMK